MCIRDRAQVLAEQGLDVETLIAAILHDTIEDTPLSRQDLAAQFGETVAELVDGVTKLDKVRFADRQEAAAESFRKMLLAMSRDLRVILIKLADRLHNMRTPVSYTHLDVYKRQPPPCARRECSCSERSQRYAAGSRQLRLWRTH